MLRLCCREPFWTSPIRPAGDSCSLHLQPASCCLVPPQGLTSPEAVGCEPTSAFPVHGLAAFAWNPFPILALLLNSPCSSVCCMRRSPEGLVELVKGVGKIQGSKIHEVSPLSAV